MSENKVIHTFMLKVVTGEYSCFNKIVETKIDLSPYSKTIFIDDIKDRIRIYEEDASGNLLDSTPLFQLDIDKEDHYGLLTLQLKGISIPRSSRWYKIALFSEKFIYQPPAPLVQATLDLDEGRECFRIQTPNAVYYYDKAGGGFTSLQDADGNDWLGFHLTGGSAGHYRGIPNLVYPEGYFHPGKPVDDMVSYLIQEGPLKVKIYTHSKDQAWTCTWDIFPEHARLTVLNAAKPYWFLYEGTPGGCLDLAHDYCVWSDGTVKSIEESWHQCLPEPKWIYFVNQKSSRMLFLYQHEFLKVTDSFRTMENNMTVFGFGRMDMNMYLNTAPLHFTIGFSEHLQHSGAAEQIYSICGDYTWELYKS